MNFTSIKKKSKRTLNGRPYELLLNLTNSMGQLESMEVQRSHEQKNREHGDNFGNESNGDVCGVGRPLMCLLK